MEQLDKNKVANKGAIRMVEQMVEKKYSASEILVMITSYNWMIKYIVNMRKELHAVYASTARYGIEAAMPHGTNIENDPIYNEQLRIERQWYDFGKIGEKIMFIQSFLKSEQYELLDEKNKMILNHTLDGAKQTQIAKVLMCSQPAIQYRQCKIAEYIHEWS